MAGEVRKLGYVESDFLSSLACWKTLSPRKLFTPPPVVHHQMCVQGCKCTVRGERRVCVASVETFMALRGIILFRAKKGFVIVERRNLISDKSTQTSARSHKEQVSRQISRFKVDKIKFTSPRSLALYFFYAKRTISSGTVI
jgi:hypothetical protein